MSAATHSLEAGSNSPAHEKKSRRGYSPTLFLWNRFRLRENAPPPTHAPGAHRALGALNLFG
ncbi:MAG: hypothetical protein FWF77_07670 [Defluviitaleaceae bacterium]|nr:hypothetical protein [Defluviitaleaceae bacterium]